MLGDQQTNEIQLQTETSNKGTLFGVLLFLAAICLYVFVARPLSADLQVMKADIVSKNEQIDELQEKLGQLQAAEEELDITSEVERIESLKAVPVGVQQDEVIRDILEIADDNDVSLNSISFGKSGSQEDGVSSLTIAASFAGNYADLTSFLEGLEQNDRLFKVDSISVQVSRLDISDIERANFSLSISAFYQE